LSELCPKCNQLGTRFVREIYGRKYVYYRHYDSNTKKVRYCYIGPADRYIHAEKKHGLKLTNIEQQDYVETAIISLIKASERLARDIARRDGSDVDYEKALEIILTRLFKRIERHRKAIENAYRGVFLNNFSLNSFS